MVGGKLIALIRDRRAAAAAEMALVLPPLMVLMFGSFELGRFFLDEHVVAKAVRDGARYAARQNFTNYSDCSAVPAGVLTNIRNLTRTGKVVSGGAARLSYWTNPATITVSVSCVAPGTYRGIYTGASNVPIVTVSAVVPYTPLFGSIGFNVSGLKLNARSQSAVMGI